MCVVGATDCVSVDPVLCGCVWSRWSESGTRRVGFRALKKTLEAPYTTKVNNLEPTTRGTTQNPNTKQICEGEVARLFS